MGQASASEIAVRIGANKSTTFRILSSMQRLGFIDRTSGGSYALGLRLMELGSLVESRLDLRRVVDPELQSVSRATALTTFLMVQHGEVATCVDRVSGTDVEFLALRLGGTLPLYLGAGPRVILAGLPEADFEEYLGGAPFKPYLANTLTTSEQLRADRALTRERGYVLSLEDVSPGLGALGVPIFDASGHVVAALSASGFRQEFDGDRANKVAALLKASADRVSSSLGAPAEVPGWVGQSAPAGATRH